MRFDKINSMVWTGGVALLLFSLLQGQTQSKSRVCQSPDQRIATAEDFKNGRLINGATRDQETFLLRVNPTLPPLKFRLIPDATVKDNPGSNNPVHRVGRVEISRGDHPPVLVQTIEVLTHAGADSFRSQFTVMDINFDGFLDIAVVDEFGAKWGRQEFWLFDKRRGRYVTNPLTTELHRITHNGIETHPETKELEVRQFSEETPRPGVLSERYKVLNGHLVLMRTEELRETSEGLRVYVRQRVNGKMRLVETRDFKEGNRWVTSDNDIDSEDLIPDRFNFIPDDWFCG